MAEETKKKRGGWRPGAGRPRTMSNQKIYTFRAGDKVGRVLDSMPKHSEFIRKCLEEYIDTHLPDISSMGECVPATNVRPLAIPQFDISIPAGFPLDVKGNDRGELTDLLSLVCPHPETSYMINVVGNSMIDANVHSGDIVIVDTTNRNPEPHQIAVCELNGEYTLKRFEKHGDTGYLVPANPLFPKIPITSDDIFNIWGTVTYIIHKPV